MNLFLEDFTEDIDRLSDGVRNLQELTKRKDLIIKAQKNLLRELKRRGKITEEDILGIVSEDTEVLDKNLLEEQEILIKGLLRRQKISEEDIKKIILEDTLVEK